nr:UvrD-helicase domain-containing protein [Elusimicrobiaceae bacterium]
MLTNKKLQDQEARKTAVENINQNIIVEAGAGTGKTTLLVKKMLFLLFVKEVKLSQIVALTFTKKAAASLKQKLEEELHTAYKVLSKYPFVLSANENDFAEQIKNYDEKQQELFNKFRTLFIKSGCTSEELFARIKTAFEEISLCQIGTIHSFCLYILKKYAVAAGLNSEINIDEGAVTNIIFDKLWASFLDEELNLTSSNKEIWMEILKEVSLKDIKQFTYTLCTPRFQDYDPRNNYNFLKEQSIKYIEEAKTLIKNHPKKVTLTNSLEESIKAL